MGDSGGPCGTESNPKSQWEPTAVPSPPLLWSVKTHVRSLHELVKPADGGVLGGALTRTDFVTPLAAPWLSVTVRVTA